MICRHCHQWLGAVTDDGDHDCTLGVEAFKARAREATPVKRHDPDKGRFLSPDLTDDEARFQGMLAIQAHRRECCARSSHRMCNWQGVFRGVEGKDKDGKPKTRWVPFMGRACTEDTECSSCAKEKAQVRARAVRCADYRSLAVPEKAAPTVVAVTAIPLSLRIKIALAVARAKEE